MTRSTPVEIHEFSTGIHPDRTPNGGWVSRGFTGHYMNVTIPEIPNAVERSIANREFAVAEGASRDLPAIIGRVVGSGESSWSVVAIVTRGRDEKGRSASLYRYFLSKGDDSLPKILAWIEEQRRNGRMTVFDPFETKIVGSPNISNIPTPRFGPLSNEVLQSYIFSDSPPVIIQPGQYNEQMLDKLATEKAKINHQPLAWACNVEALEQPRRFQIIQAASPKAYDLLQRAKVNNSGALVPVVPVDEQAIKSAIKGLIGSSTAKLEYVETFANSLGNPQIPENYWQDIFEKQGADKARSQGIYSPQYVRLLMLRAIALPKTLPSYLVWLEKGTKQDNPYTVAAEFDAQFSECFKQNPTLDSYIENRITEGWKIFIPMLLAGELSSESINKLLTSENGTWSKLSRHFRQVLDDDLKLMSNSSSGQQNLNFQLTDEGWQIVWEDLNSYWPQNYKKKPNPKYLPLAQVLQNLGDTQTSAFFYQIGCGKVPDKIFYKLEDSKPNTRIYEFDVERNLTITELLFNLINLGSLKVPVGIVIPLVFICFSVGFTLRGFFPATLSEAKPAATFAGGNNNNYPSCYSDNNQQTNNVNYDDKRANETVTSSPEYPQSQEKEKADYEKKIKNFSKSRDAIKNILQQLSDASNGTCSPEIINAKIFQILQTPNINNLDMTYINNINIFLGAIKKYQKNKNISDDGVINEKQKTSEVLKCEVARSLKIPLNGGCNDCNSIP